MEAELGTALKRRGTLYSGLAECVLHDLATAAQRHGLVTAKEAAAAFDKWMAVHRLGVKSVGAEDVAAWASEYGRARPQAARPGNLFNRGSLEDIVLADVGGDAMENVGGAANGGASGPSARLTPYLARAAAAKAHTPATSGKFGERANAGAVVASLNAHLEVPAAAASAAAGEAMDVDGGAGGGAALEVEVLGAPPAGGTKYMVHRLEARVAYLEARILAAEAAVGGEVHPTGAAAQQPATFVGRVVCDSEGGRLNPQSLLLEGSQRSSGGARVRLDVAQAAAGYRLFPGQVVAVRGTNPSGHCVVATEVLPGHALPLPATPLERLAAVVRPWSLVAAAGPFTPADDLEYAPLAALLEYAAQQRPDVLLLLGPFVDAEHPAVRGGLLEQTFDDLFESRVLSQVERFSLAVGGATRVLLMPSTRDVHAHPVLPQPPLEVGSRAAAGTTALANPATLRCAEVVLGAGASDWLLAAGREEVCGGRSEERLPALAGHLAGQRSYYPLYPPPADVPLDCGLAAAGLAMPCTPDLLLTPSDLAPFAKLCPVYTAPPPPAAGGEPAAPPAAQPASGGSLVVVNPGRLAKGSSGGTFAHIHILPLSEAVAVAGGEPAATNAPVPHQLDRRCRVEIKRI